MSECMPAVVYKAPGHFALEMRPVPKIIHPSDAIVQVTMTSICSSDIHIKHGSVPKARPGIIVGHEMVGIVTECGSALSDFAPGDGVTVNVETFCGQCFYCQKGFVNNCTVPDGGWSLGCRIDGGQTMYVRVPHAQNGLNHIPDNVTDEQAIFTGDILSTGYWGAQISEISAKDTVAVIGAGPTGLCTMLCARLYKPAQIIAIDTDPDRLKLALHHKIADMAINPATQNIVQEIAGLTSKRGADIVIEAAGGKDTFQMAWQIARPNAIVTIIALYDENQILPLPRMYGKNLTFKTGGVDACHCDDILQFISKGQLDTTSLITHHFPLKQAMDAYDLFENKKDGVMKVILTP